MSYRSIYLNVTTILICLMVLLSGCSTGNSVDNGNSVDIGNSIGNGISLGSGNSSDNVEETTNIHNGENQDGKNASDSSLAGDKSPAEQSIAEREQSVTEKKNISEKDQDISKSDKAETDGSFASNNDNIVAVEKVDAGKGEDNAGSEEDSVIELIPMAQLPELTLKPRDPIPLEKQTGYGHPVLTPVYLESFRYQIREIRDAYLAMDIGNTGSETLVITDENLRFSILDEEGNESAGSRVQGAPVQIAPGEIKRVVVTAENPEAGFLFVDIGGLSFSIINPIFRPLGNEAKGIDDTTPYHKSEYTMEYNGITYIESRWPMQVVGNGKAKIMGCGLMVVENEKIGPIVRGDDGFIALVRVKLANTSDEVMNIDKISIVRESETIDVYEKDLAVLGDKALPFTISPYSIVEGWVPFKVREGEYHGIILYTNFGGYILADLQGYPIF